MNNKEKLPAHEHPFYANMFKDGLEFVAHRGGDGGYENSHQAFQTANDSGINIIETDIRCTLDGVPVHFHGDKKTKKILRSTQFKDINKPKVLRMLGIDQPGIEIPRLEDTLHEFPDTSFFLDLKADNTTIPVAKIIQKTKSQDRISIDGHRWKRAVEVSKAVPGGVSTTINPIGLIALYSTVKNIPMSNNHANFLKMPGLKTLKNRWLNKATSLSLPMKWADEHLIDIARDLDIPVFIHHIENKDHVNFAKEIGAQGIMADSLELAKKI